MMTMMVMQQSENKEKTWQLKQCQLPLVEVVSSLKGGMNAQLKKQNMVPIREMMEQVNNI